MQAGDWFQVDLGSSQTFNQVVLDTTASSGDSPHGYQLFVSDDGTNWGQPVATGPGSPVTRILIPQVTARFIRVVNQGDAGNWWSMHELNVLGPAAGAAGATFRPHGGVQRKTAVLPDGTQLLVAYNSGRSVATFDVPWGDSTYTYRLPSGAAAIFTTSRA
jgi:hypothetical protein